MTRTILENPKTAQQNTMQLEEKSGFITPYWMKKVENFYRSIIPSHIGKDKQIWLYTSEDVVDFVNKIKDQNYNISNIQYICIVGTISGVYDIFDFFTDLKNKLPEDAKIIYSNYNWRLEPAFKLSAFLGFSRKSIWGAYYRNEDLDCFLNMSGWENVFQMNRYLLPFELGFITKIFDFLVRLPLLDCFALNTIFIARTKNEKKYEDHSVTVLVPCKNEEENIEAIVKRTPEIGKNTELLFINDNSTDKTEEKILQLQKQLPEKNIRIVQGEGKGKGEAVRVGMKEAKGDICMVLADDLSVIPEDLPQFYDAINSRRADFINGTRMIYHQEDEAMKLANLVGNYFFSFVFSYILEQRITDTLCGTKVFWRKDWPAFEEMRSILKNKDVWGDYNLIFGAARFGLKMGELPVRYFQRLKGLTKMTKRIKNGFIMLRVAWYALWQIKFFG